mgnify:CR=1 FL=1
MSEIAETNKKLLNSYPDYKCYALEVKGNGRATQGNFDQNKVSISWLWSFDYHWYDGVGVLIPTEVSLSVIPHGTIGQDDHLLIHPDVKVPKKLISCGTPINDKSTDLPSKLVIPEDFPSYLLNKYRALSDVVLLVNEDAKIVFFVHCYVWLNETIGGNPHQWVNTLVKEPSLYREFGEELRNFTMPYGVQRFTAFFKMTELDAAITSGMIPKEVLVAADDVQTGSEPLTVDMLYSTYMMLQSPDDQIVETAFNLLAQSKFGLNKAVIKWLLKPYRRTARCYKSKSTAFAWLYNRCQCYNNSTIVFNNYQNTVLAKDLIRRITNRGIDWNPEGVLVVNNSDWLNDNHLRELIQAV